MIQSATELLEETLQIDPCKRVSAATALTSQYFAPYHDVADELTPAKAFDWAFLEADLPVDVWRTVL
jgi:p38 MAP kinase